MVTSTETGRVVSYPRSEASLFEFRYHSYREIPKDLSHHLSASL